MSRVNFYQLLDLKINPPESDPDTIEAAIKKKQAEWSRLRNHPTKGTQARQYISLLTEIRKTMGDSKLREMEARNAIELLKKKLEAKFRLIDNHIFLIGSKGDISTEEIARLADFHKVKQQIIQRRVDRWRKKHSQPLEFHLNRVLISERPDEKAIEKIASQFQSTIEEVHAVLKKLLDERSVELDAYINIQIRKGFMSEKEISSLADIYALDQGEILRRVRCPIKKGATSDADHAYQLDSTVEQFINENLKVVEQDSLYSFLGLFPGSALEALQKKAVEKENEIRKIAQKGAFVTASGVLAGQCISIFKSDESRYAYDLSRARSLLKNLNQDIRLAADHNSVRIEYYHYLLRKAVSFGAIPDEARQHILDFCQSKGWKVELPKKKRNLRRYAKVALITFSALLIAGSAFWYFYFSKQRVEEEFVETIKKATEQPTLEGEIRVFENYLSSADREEYRERASKNIESLQKRIVQRDFKEINQTAEQLYNQQHYEEIQDLYNQFLMRHGASAWAAEIRSKSEKLPALIDERDYQKILTIPKSEPEAIAHDSATYLRQHQEGAHVKEVRAILQNVAIPYYREVETALAQCENREEWNQCIEVSSRYIEVYRDSRYALQLKEKRDEYRINLQNKAILDALIAKSGGRDADPEAKRVVFEDFLRSSSNSPAASLVQRELFEIRRQLGHKESQQEKERLLKEFAKKGSRFNIKNTDTVFDTKTGLTWMLIDSRLSSDQCMTYEEAQRYVKSMTLGGYSDWRLPKAKELVDFLSPPSPFLQGATSDWYWSSDSFKRYSGGWIILVDVVTSRPRLSVAKQDAKNCGWFRAVRP
jgi:hypothetical protein